MLRLIVEYFKPINNNIKTYENIRKHFTGQRDDYTFGCLLDYPYLKRNLKQNDSIQ